MWPKAAVSSQTPMKWALLGDGDALGGGSLVDIAALLVGGVLVRPRDSDGAGWAVACGRDGAVLVLTGWGPLLQLHRIPTVSTGRGSPGGADVGGGGVLV